MISRRGFLTQAAAATAANLFVQRASGASSDLAPARQRPNILVFMPDQQQGSTVLPEHPCLKPRMDRFAKESVTFSNAFCPSPHCCPSRASFMTGMYPSEHGIFNNVDTDSAIHLDPYPNTPHFSKNLKEAGYNLGYAGKWHVGRTLTPEAWGWENLTPDTPVWETYDPKKERANSSWRVPHLQLQDESPRKQGEVIRPGWGDLQFYKTQPAGYEHLEDYKFVKQGLAGMTKLAAGTAPWCLMVSNNGGHDLYDVPKEFVDLYDPDRIELPPNFRDDLLDKPRVYQRMRYQYWAQLSDAEVKNAIAHYWAKLTMQDHFFGLLLDELEKTGQADNTLVIYTSDHGDYAGAHGLWAKGVPAFREGYNIPCILRWPKEGKAAGRRVDAFVSTTDFSPTILEAAGLTSACNSLSGKSLLPWLRSETPSDWRTEICSQLNGVELYYTQRSVSNHEYKYVYNGFDYDELYDLKRDPHELTNLAFPDMRQAVAQMHAGAGGGVTANSPWPHVDPKLEAVRRELLEKMWTFAKQHNDQIFNNYLTVALAPYGPGVFLGTV